MRTPAVFPASFALFDLKSVLCTLLQVWSISYGGASYRFLSKQVNIGAHLEPAMQLIKYPHSIFNHGNKIVIQMMEIHLASFFRRLNLTCVRECAPWSL